MTDTRVILNTLKKKLEEVYSNSIDSVVLFGSQATNVID
jgi:hypothetical protein